MVTKRKTGRHLRALYLSPVHQLLSRAVVAVLISAGPLAGLTGSAAGAVDVGRPERAPQLPYGLSVADPAALAAHGDLAFVSQGKLLVMAASTGKLTDLGGASGLQPGLQFSPNGKWLAYELGSGSVWVARADGRDGRHVPGQGPPEWLPDNRVKVGNSLWSVSSNGTLHRAGSAAALRAWSNDGKEYVFLRTGPTVKTGRTYRTTWRLEVSSSVGGPRTTWYHTVITVNPNGAHGNYITNVFVIPGHQGLLVEVDPDLDDDADGNPIYDVRSPGAALVKLATMLGPKAGGTVTFGPDGTFVLGAGPNRYAWMTKSVLVCDVARQRCRALPVPKRFLSLDPAWSPNGQVLAFVEAPSSNLGNFFPATVSNWYSTHHLLLLKSGSAATEVPGTQGASVPLWSGGGRSLMYVSGDGLWLLRLGHKPLEVAAPLFAPPWPSYYGQVDWAQQFAWSAAPAEPGLP